MDVAAWFPLMVIVVWLLKSLPRPPGPQPVPV